MKVNLRIKIFSLIALNLLVYFPSLFNDFSGDDRFFLTQNIFYDHPRNLSRLFSRDYNIDLKEYTLKNDGDKGTGSVAYRPVLTVTYFIDKFIWKNNPLGFHLTNLLYHICNAILVLLLINQSWPVLAWLVAAIFSIHPIQTEAVCSIGYRADVLSSFWSLSAIWLWIKFRKQSVPSYFIFSLICYFLSVFSKESALPTLCIFFFFDRYIQKIPLNIKTIRIYVLPASISLFYCYVYFFVFPNSALHFSSKIIGVNLPFDHLKSILLIWGQHLYSLLWPFQITLIPTLFMPDLTGAAFKFIWPILSIISYLAVVFYSIKKNTMMAFSLLWFLFFYLPVSNMIPQPSPMGYRLMYLPSIGIFMLLAFGLRKSLIYCEKNWKDQQIIRIFIPVFLTALAICSFTTCFFWKNNFTIAREWIARYPDQYKGYEVLAQEFYAVGLFDQAVEYFQKSYSLKKDNPTIAFQIGQCFLKIGQADQAEPYFIKTIETFPMYLHGYDGLLNVFAQQKKLEQMLVLRNIAKANLNENDFMILEKRISALNLQNFPKD